MKGSIIASLPPRPDSPAPAGDLPSRFWNRRRLLQGALALMVLTLIVTSVVLVGGALSQRHHHLKGTLEMTNCPPWGLTPDTTAEVVSESGQTLASAPISFDQVPAPGCRLHFSIRIQPLPIFHIRVGPRFTYDLAYQAPLETSSVGTKYFGREGVRFTLTYAS